MIYAVGHGGFNKQLLKVKKGKICDLDVFDWSQIIAARHMGHLISGRARQIGFLVPQNQE